MGWGDFAILWVVLFVIRMVFTFKLRSELIRDYDQGLKLSALRNESEEYVQARLRNIRAVFFNLLVACAVMLWIAGEIALLSHFYPFPEPENSPTWAVFLRIILVGALPGMAGFFSLGVLLLSRWNYVSADAHKHGLPLLGDSKYLQFTLVGMNLLGAYLLFGDPIHNLPILVSYLVASTILIHKGMRKIEKGGVF